jgi:spermidine synthase
MNTLGKHYILASVFLSGAVVMSLEITGSRILAPYFGSSIYVWGSLIGVVLSALALGYYLGGKLSDSKVSVSAYSILILLAGITSLLIPVLAYRAVSVIRDFMAGSIYGPLLATVVILGVPAVLLGMIPPYALKLSIKRVENVGNIAGQIYSVSTLGSIFGTFLTVFVLIPAMGVTYIIMAQSILLILFALIPLRNRSAAIAGVVFLLLILPSYFMILNNLFNNVIDSLRYNKVYETDTLYYHVVVADDKLTGRERILFIDNHRHSSMYLDNHTETSFDYPYYFNLGFAFNGEIKDVLFIGGGGMSAPKKFLKEYDDIHIDVVEIDPKVVEIAKKFFVVPDDPRLDIHVEDGRVFIERTEKRYDLIVLDAYTGNYVPFHLMTYEFFELVEKRLKPGGIVISNLITPLSGDLATLFKSEYRTMSEFFPDIHVFPLGHTMLPGNVIIVASKEKHDIQEITERTTNSKYKEYLEKHYSSAIDISGASILTDDYAPVNNYINPLSGRSFIEESS